MSEKRKSNSYLPSILAATGVGVLAVCCVLGYRHWQPFVVKTMLDPNPIRVALSLDRDWHGKLGLSTKNYEVCLVSLVCETTFVWGERGEKTTQNIKRDSFLEIRLIFFFF